MNSEQKHLHLDENSITECTFDQSSETRQTMVKIDDVTMIFNIASEQLNNLKEYFIAIARKELMFKEFKALQNISLDVKKGDVFGIIGTNGSGKSTLMKIIAGVLDPSSGTCKVNGNIAPLIELGAGFDEDLTARENVYLNGALLGYSRSFIDKHFDDIVKFAEVEDFLDMPLKNYSSGMVSRIAFAIATVIVPEILLVDEVLSVGDFMFQKKCESRIKDLINKHGVTVLIVSHSNDQIARLCNKAIWIEKGKSRLIGNAQDVCRVYGALGGRNGSIQAEQKLFEYMVNSIDAENPATEHIIDNSPIDLTSILASHAFISRKSTRAIMASSASHVNFALAAPFAKAYNAALMAAGIEDVPFRVEHLLLEHRPKEFITFDCGKSSKNLLEDLSHFSWKPQYIDLTSTDGNPYTYSLGLFEHGHKEKMWGDTAVMVDYKDELETIAIAPYLYQHTLPLIITWQEYEKHDALFEQGLKTLKDNGIKNIIALGPSLSQESIATLSKNFTLKILAHEQNDVKERMVDIAKYQIENFPKNKKFNVLMGSADRTQLLYLQAACNHTANEGILFLVDTSNMDNTVAAIQLLEEYSPRINNICFFGSEKSFFPEDCQLLATAAHSKH